MTDHQFDTLYSEIKGIKHILTGNGEPHKGIIVRLDRVEVKLRTATWLLRASFVAAVTALGYLAVEVATKLM